MVSSMLWFNFQLSTFPVWVLHLSWHNQRCDLSNVRNIPLLAKSIPLLLIVPINNPLSTLNQSSFQVKIRSTILGWKHSLILNWIYIPFVLKLTFHLVKSEQDKHIFSFLEGLFVLYPWLYSDMIVHSGHCT